jgi:hypothetical protein
MWKKKKKRGAWKRQQQRFNEKMKGTDENLGSTRCLQDVRLGVLLLAKKH